jgi:hypothetical protein
MNSLSLSLSAEPSLRFAQLRYIQPIIFPQKDWFHNTDFYHRGPVLSNLAYVQVPYSKRGVGKYSSISAGRWFGVGRQDAKILAKV